MGCVWVGLEGADVGGGGKSENRFVLGGLSGGCGVPMKLERKKSV